MQTVSQLISSITAGDCDRRLVEVYAPEGGASLEAARSRVLRIAEAFRAAFSPAGGCPALLVSGPGRTELGGNHTDHQHGHVLCGSVDLDMLACVSPNGKQTVRLISEGYAPLEISLDALALRPEEQGSSAALVRGVLARLRELGAHPEGFDAYISSNVPAGSGLSSSAAYEVLLGTAVSYLFCGGGLDPVELAKAGQYAENAYFGKPCGLMDQMGSAVGGAIAIDFADPANPVLRKAAYDFRRSGHALCIVDTASSHDDLTEDYAAVPREMGAVAAYFEKRFLREVPETDFRANLPELRQRCGDRAVLRAMHFYAEDRRVQEEAAALEDGDFSRFLGLVNASGLSSELLLQNIWSVSHPERQAVSLALARGRELLEGTGAIRVHGGGFAGTIQAFVPEEKLRDFRAGMEALLGAGRCHVLRIRPQGGCLVLPAEEQEETE